MKRKFNLSIWKDIFENNNIREQRVSELASDTSTSPYRAYNIALKQNINGSKTLSFSMNCRVRDIHTGELIDNPLMVHLINEAKIKLKVEVEQNKYKWFTFVISQAKPKHNKQGLIYEYSCTDIFQRELARNGKQLEFDELTGFGTASDLITTVLSDTGWTLDRSASDAFPEYQDKYIVDADGMHYTGATDDFDRTTGLLERDQITSTKKEYLSDFSSHYEILEPTLIPSVGETIYTETDYQYITGAPTNMMYNAENFTSTDGWTVPYRKLSTWDKFVYCKSQDEFNALSKDRALYMIWTGTAPTTLTWIGTTGTTTSATINYEDCVSIERMDRGYKLEWKTQAGITLLDKDDYNNVIRLASIDTDQPGAHATSLAVTDRVAYMHSSNDEMLVTNAMYKANKLKGGTKYVVEFGQLFEAMANIREARDPYAYVEKIIITNQPMTEHLYRKINTNDLSWSDKDGIRRYCVISPTTIAQNRCALNPRGTFIYQNREESYADWLYQQDTLLYKTSVSKNLVNNPGLEKWKCFARAELPLVSEFPTNLAMTFKALRPRCKYWFQLDYDFDTPYVTFVVRNGRNSNFGSRKMILFNLEYARIYPLLGSTAVLDGHYDRIYERFGALGNDNQQTYHLYPEASSVASYQSYHKKYFTLSKRTNTEFSFDNINALGELDTQQYVKHYIQIGDYLSGLNEDNPLPDNYQEQEDSQNLQADNKIYYKDSNWYTINNNVYIEPNKYVYEQYPSLVRQTDKYRTLVAKNSSRYNLLQTICELFEGWIDYDVIYDENGYLVLDADGQPQKVVRFKENIGRDLNYGFTYGFNQSGISKTVDTNEIVTKLYTSDLSSNLKGEICSVINARYNPLKARYMYSFEYYLKNGLLDKDSFYTDYKQFQKRLLSLNTQILQYSDKLIQYDSAKNSTMSALKAFQSKESALQERIAANIAAMDNTTTSVSSIAIRTQSEIDELETLYEDMYVPQVQYVYNTFTFNTDFSLYVPTLTEAYLSIPTYDYKSETKLAPDEYFLDYTTQIYKTKLKETYNTLLEYADPRMVESVYTDYVLKGGALSADTPRNLYFQYYGVNYVLQAYRHTLDSLNKQAEDVIKTFETKYRNYILEGECQTANYVDSDDYYQYCLKVLYNSSMPKVSYTIDAKDIQNAVRDNDAFANYNFEIGDKTFVIDTELFGYQEDAITPRRLSLVITEKTDYLDNPSKNTIVAKNYKTQFIDLFQKITAAVAAVSYNEIATKRFG